MGTRAQATGGEEWRGDIFYVGQQQGAHLCPPSAALGSLQSLARGIASLLCCSDSVPLFKTL